MAAPQINNYAALPQNVVLDTGLPLRRTDWRWIHCLSLQLKAQQTPALSKAVQMDPLCYWSCCWGRGCPFY